MISAVFVDRPRLAIVIAIIISIAGALSLTRIPVAQFPDIVPPQVQVAATYPGASANVVESAVAQPLEAQIVGVDQMLYMKSSSGNDGSYNLTVSFALGTNPDIDTVNVQEPGADAGDSRCCRPRCNSRACRVRKKRSAARVAGAWTLYSADSGQLRPAFPVELTPPSTCSTN